MAGKTVLILGGGVGGIVAARALRRRLGPEHRVALVDRQAQYVFTPSLLWAMVGRLSPAQITRDLRSLVPRDVAILRAEVEEIEPDQSRIHVNAKTHSYDYLVVSLGADLAPQTLPGYQEAAHNFFSLDGAVSLWSALRPFTGGRVAVLVSALPFKCPAAPYEAALLLEDALRRLGARSRSQVALFTPEPQPMPVAGPAMGRAVVQMLERQSIAFHPTRQVQRVEPESRELVFADGTREPFDLLAAVPPHRPPEVIKSSPLANDAGWVPVDKRTLATRYENVYAIGDVASIPLANGRPLPKAGVFAHAQAEVVAARIAAQIRGAAATQDFDGAGYCWIEMGQGAAAFASGRFYAEPDPVVLPHPSGRLWHLGKVLFEQYWLSRGPRRALARLGLNLGSRLLGVPADL
jgi:sulfide:quinone oxidoreductase